MTRWVLVVAWVAVLAGSASGAPDPEETDVDQPVLQPLRVQLILSESLLILVAPAIYYWANTNLQKEDWELDWTWESWRAKLTTLDKLNLDTGYWEANAIRHPLAGALQYQVARASGISQFTSTMLDLASSLAWEYVVEFKEKISVNDLFVNTMSGFALGEPLFQLGLAADRPGASWGRKAVGWLVSPVHRLHTAAGYSSWRVHGAPWSRFALELGGRTTELRDGGRTERPTRNALVVGLDLEVGDRRYGRPGEGIGKVAPGQWGQLVAGAQLGTSGLARAWVRSRTTYGGRTHRSISADGTGTDWRLDVAAGLDYESRRLTAEWDHLVVFNVVGTRLTLLSWRDGQRRVRFETAGSADLAMVQAHVFGPRPPFVPLPQRSVLQARGYYYATGLTAAARLDLQVRRWSAALEARAHHLWSIDGFDRIELDGGSEDPHHVTDQRLFGRAVVGIEPGRPGLRLELMAEGTLRRGSWNSDSRITTELGFGGGVSMEF